MSSLLTLRAIGIGSIAAVVATLPLWLWNRTSHQVDWFHPLAILFLGLFFWVLDKYIFHHGRAPTHAAGYSGVSDLLLHIHHQPSIKSEERWTWRGLFSFLLGSTGVVGVEGAAMELAQGFSNKTDHPSGRWYEQHRRTDVASVMAAGMAAAFGAPFAAVLLPAELGVGGRTLSAVVSAIVAFIGINIIESVFGYSTITFLDLFKQSESQVSAYHPRDLVCVLLTTISIAVVGTGLIRFIRFGRKSFRELFANRAWLHIFVGTGLLVLTYYAFFLGRQAPSLLFQQVWEGGVTIYDVLLLSISSVLTITLVLSVFGSCGVFWPIFALGSFLGVAVGFACSASSALMIWVGGAAIWGAFFGAPLVGTVLAFEMTGNPVLLLPCLVAALGAAKIREKLKTPAFFDFDTETRGDAVEKGRSVQVLESLFIRDAMVTDHKVVNEHDGLIELHKILLQSRYPFLPVLNNKGRYIGLLTADMIEDAWSARERASDQPGTVFPLSKILEAKDLLYRFGGEIKTVFEDDTLHVTSGLFEQTPVVPVLDREHKVVGLLFAYNVRIVYDREVAQRALFYRKKDSARKND